MDPFAVFDVCELGHPFADVFALAIKLLALTHGIENSEVRLWVDAATDAKAPSS